MTASNSLIKQFLRNTIEDYKKVINLVSVSKNALDAYTIIRDHDMNYGLCYYSLRANYPYSVNTYIADILGIGNYIWYTASLYRGGCSDVNKLLKPLTMRVIWMETILQLIEIEESEDF